MMIQTLALLLAACGVPAEAPPAPEAAPDGPKEVVLACPEGSVQRQENTGQGPEQFCDKGGIKHGPFARTYDDGQRAVEGSYAMGQPDGAWFWFHPTGKKSQKGLYNSGKPVGNWTHWFENGNPMEEGDYLNGRKAGTWVTFYESGRKQEEGLYQNGVKNGPWSYFADDEANSLIRTETWQSGHLEETKPVAGK